MNALARKHFYGKPQNEIANELGISQGYWSQILNGQRDPSLALAARIERMTGGEVPASSWVVDEKL